MCEIKDGYIILLTMSGMFTLLMSVLTGIVIIGTIKGFIDNHKDLLLFIYTSAFCLFIYLFIITGWIIVLKERLMVCGI